MRFIGLDLAWGSKNTTGAVALERQNAATDGPPVLVVTAKADALLTDDDIVKFVGDNDDGGGIIVGIDAPLDVPNQSGERPVEAALRRCFGRFQAGAHPANRNRLGPDVRGERIARRLESERGMISGYDFAARDESARQTVEVFPHPAMVVLFGLAKTLKYKAKPGRDTASRLAEFARFTDGLKSLQTADPALLAPDWLSDSLDGLTGKALKQREDLLDALMCAYIAAYFWQWGDGERCMVIGDKTNGYIVTSTTPDLRACIETFLAAPS